MKRPLAILAAMLTLGLGGWWLAQDPSPEDLAASPGAASMGDEAPPPPMNARTPAPRGRVSGRVWRDGAPAVAARVTLRGAATLVTSTLDDGAFLFDDVPAGLAYVSASAAGAASDVVGPLQVFSGGRIDGLVLTLAPSVRVDGQVVDLLTQRPIAGASVVAPAQATRTDDAGRFSLEGPRAQTWIDVVAPGYISRTEWVSLELARAGGRLVLVLTPSSFIEGQVLEAGAPVANASVWAEEADGARRGDRTQVVFTNAQGRFVLEVPPSGLQPVAVTPRGQRVQGPFVRLALGERRQGVLLEAGERASAEGVVARAGGPVSGAQLSAVDATSEQVAAVSVSGPDGRFRFEALTLGRYLVQARLPGGVAALAGPFEHLGDGRPWSVLITEGGVLEGRVEPPSAGVLVRWRSGAWSGPAAEVLTDARGGFRFEGVPLEWVSIDAEGPSGAATARGRPGDEVVLTLRKGLVTVRLLDAAGAPVTDGMILARSADTGAARRLPALAPDGIARVELPNGEWELTLEVVGRGRSRPASVKVGPASADVELVLEAAVSVRGCVRDAVTQLPLAGARIDVTSGVVGREARVEAMTDARGEFVLPPVPASAFMLARRDGYAPTRRRADAGERWDVALQPVSADRSPPTETQFEGVGMVLSPSPEGAVVSQVNEGGPAERAGIQPGDVIQAVDGAPVAGQPLAAIVSLIRGPAGTPVRLLLARRGQGFELTLRRRLLTL